MSTSGMPITDCLLEGYTVASRTIPAADSSARARVRRELRRLLDAHPVYIDPNQLAGRRLHGQLHVLSQAALEPRLRLRAPARGSASATTSVRASAARSTSARTWQIGLRAGLGRPAGARSATTGIENAARRDGFYDGLEEVVLGMQDWIGRHAEAARSLAERETDPAAAGEPAGDGRDQRAPGDRAAADVPRGVPVDPVVPDGGAHVQRQRLAGAAGRAAVPVLRARHGCRVCSTTRRPSSTSPACCCATRPTSSLAGPTPSGRDVTNPVSFLVLEAAHRLKIPANVGVCVGDARGSGAAAARRGDHVGRQDGHAQVPGRRADGGGLQPQRLPAGAGPRSAPIRAATGRRSRAASIRSTTA